MGGTQMSFHEDHLKDCWIDSGEKRGERILLPDFKRHKCFGLGRHLPMLNTVTPARARPDAGYGLLSFLWVLSGALGELAGRRGRPRGARAAAEDYDPRGNMASNIIIRPAPHEASSSSWARAPCRDLLSVIVVGVRAEHCACSRATVRRAERCTGACELQTPQYAGHET